MANYRFTTTWKVTAPVEDAWQAVSRLEDWPHWWPGMQTALVRPGDDEGLGAQYRCALRSPLGYELVFVLEEVAGEPPYLAEFRAAGDLEGVGRLELSRIDLGTSLRFHWSVATTKAWMNVLAPLGRPAFNWAHGMVMRRGGTRFAAHLGARLIGIDSRAQPAGRVGVALLVTPIVLLVARKLRPALAARFG